MRTSFNKIKKNGLVLAALLFLCLYLSKLNSKDTFVNVGFVSDRSSISLVEGKYKIDSSVIRNDINKKRLVFSLIKEPLNSKYTVKEIPSFVRSFLDSVSYGKKFDLVNPGEEWKSGITDYGHQIITKTYDAAKNDTVLILSGDGAVLPDKQLVYFGIGKNMALLSYLRGGFGSLQNIIILKFEKETVVDFWYGGANDGSIATKKDILKCLMLAKKNNGC